MSAPGQAPPPGPPVPGGAPVPVLRHPRSARLLTPAAFQTVFAHGRRIAGRCFQLHVLPLGEAARLGLAVSRKVDRRAVVRNRIRRIAREAFRHARPQLAAADYVLVARRDAATADRATLRAEATALLQRAAALKPGAGGGTMPAAAPSGAPPADSPS